MPGLAIAAASSAAWAEFGAQAERAWNTGWGFDQRADGAGGWVSNASPTSSGFTFQSTGDATGYYLTGRGFKCVQAGGTTTYGTVGLSSFAGGITSVYVNQFSTQGSTVMSTGVITSVAVSPVILGFGGNVGGLVSIVPSTGGDSAIAIGASPATAGPIRIANSAVITSRNNAGNGNVNLIRAQSNDLVELGPGGVSVMLLGDIRIGTTPSVSGGIRLANATVGTARNAANSIDITWLNVFSDNKVYIGDAANDAGLVLRSAGPVWLQPLTAGQVDFRYAVVALGGGAAPTLGTIGGAGPAVAAQNSWLQVQINGTNSWIPVWR